MYVPIPKDLGKVKTKLVFGLTRRQIICFGTAAAIGVPFYILTHKTLGSSVSAALMIIIMLPLFFLAMYERDGIPAEKVLRNIARKMIWPAKRPFQTENLYDYLKKEGKKYRLEQNSIEIGKEPKRRHASKAVRQ